MLARDWLNTYYLEDTGLFRVSLVQSPRLAKDRHYTRYARTDRPRLTGNNFDLTGALLRIDFSRSAEPAIMKSVLTKLLAFLLFAPASFAQKSIPEGSRVYRRNIGRL